MRHGEAGHIALSDVERQLTERGKSDSVAVMKQALEHDELHVDRVFVSPYLRAQETWQEVSAYVSADAVELCDDITPYGQSDCVYDYLMALKKTTKLDSLLIVSHLPLVGYLTSEFVKDVSPPMFPTSGLVCIDFDPETEQGQLLWKIYP